MVIGKIIYKMVLEYIFGQKQKVKVNTCVIVMKAHGLMVRDMAMAHSIMQMVQNMWVNGRII